MVVTTIAPTSQTRPRSSRAEAAKNANSAGIIASNEASVRGAEWVRGCQLSSCPTSASAAARSALPGSAVQTDGGSGINWIAGKISARAATSQKAGDRGIGTGPELGGTHTQA